MINEVFEITDRKCGGIGLIADSGYRLRPAYADFDAERRFCVEGIRVAESKNCISGLILQGLKKPHECPAFGKRARCKRRWVATMVSSEGAAPPITTMAASAKAAPVKENEKVQVRESPEVRNEKRNVEGPQ